MSKYFVLTAVLAIFSFTTQAWADDDCPKGIIQGAWAEGEIVPNPIPSFCSRIFACVSKSEAEGQSTMSDPDCKRIYTNPPARRMVTGACSADGGAVDSCNKCLASAPDDACEYHYEHD